MRVFGIYQRPLQSCARDAFYQILESNGSSLQCKSPKQCLKFMYEYVNQILNKKEYVNQILNKKIHFKNHCRLEIHIIHPA